MFARRDPNSSSSIDYPPEAKRLAASHIALLRRLPLGFLPLLLSELIVYDWKFPGGTPGARQTVRLSRIALA